MACSKMRGKFTHTLEREALGGLKVSQTYYFQDLGCSKESGLFHWRNERVISKK